VPRSDLSTTLVRFDEEYEKLLVPVETRERPPMLTIPEYKEQVRPRADRLAERFAGGFDR
jgi:hypothetical protein